MNELAWRDYFTEPELQALITKAQQQSVTCAPPCQAWSRRVPPTALRADRVPGGRPGLICSAIRAPGDLNFTGRPIAWACQHQLGVGFYQLGDRPGRVRNMNEAALQTYLAARRRPTRHDPDACRPGGGRLVSRCASSTTAFSWPIRRWPRVPRRRRFARRVEVGSSSKLDFVQVELLWQQASALVTSVAAAAQHAAACAGPAGG